MAVPSSRYADQAVDQVINVRTASPRNIEFILGFILGSSSGRLLKNSNLATVAALHERRFFLQLNEIPAVILLRLRATALALRVLRLRATALALRVLRLRATALALADRR